MTMLENSEYRWITEFTKTEKGEEVDETDLPPTKFTSAGQNKQRKGFTKEYGGWNLDGIKRYNELLDMVRNDRIENGKWFDDIVLKRIKRNSLDDSNAALAGGEEIKAGNDLFEVDEESDSEDLQEDHIAEV